MNEKPEALRLADLLDEKWHRWKDDPTDELKAAAELRRLHALNSDLLEALKKISEIENQEWGADWEEIEEARDIADAAIAKAQETK